VTTDSLLADLRGRGVVLSVNAGELRYRAPRGALTDELRALVRIHKLEILAALVAEGTPELESTSSSQISAPRTAGDGLPPTTPAAVSGSAPTSCATCGALGVGSYYPQVILSVVKSDDKDTYSSAPEALCLTDL